MVGILYKCDGICCTVIVQVWFTHVLRLPTGLTGIIPPRSATITMA
jgi:hypothetical protein